MIFAMIMVVFTSMPDLSNLARQADTRSGFIASLVAVYQRKHQVDDGTLASQLHSEVSDLGSIFGSVESLVLIIL